MLLKVYTAQTFISLQEMLTFISRYLNTHTARWFAMSKVISHIYADIVQVTFVHM